MGNNRMIEVYDILHRHAYFLSPICQLLEAHVYQPIATGGPITLRMDSKTSEKLLLQRIEDAVDLHP